jgi:N-acetylmannosamine-6-phosphate 2-epimerase/N-acetylmannosamine kinase
MNDFTKFHSALQGNLIVSCQAPEGSAFCDPASMAHFAGAAVEGGAAGIRANGPGDIHAIRQAVSVPIVGIWKALQDDGRILITPSFEAAQQLVGAGADLIALDCTRRGQAYGALDRLQRIRAELGVPALADIATVEEAVQAAGAGADAVLSTLRGYTPETQHVTAFEPSFIAELVRAVGVPVIAEGRIWTPRQGCEALDAGAFAIIVGTAITRPDAITRSFVSGLQARQRFAGPCGHFIGIDLGATRTKYGLVSGRGELLYHLTSPTPTHGGRDCLLKHLKETVAGCLKEAQRRGIKLDAVGVATAGWVDPATGQVVYATENLPGWTGAAIGSYLGDACGLPVVVENDANALAVAEKQFGAARTVSDFVCITLGTGVGGGCYVGQRLNRGSHFFANGLGHIPIQPEGIACTCGLSGCLETYTNSSALLRYAAPGNFPSAEEVIAAANSGDSTARNAIRTLAAYLAMGCASIVHLLDPELLILAGGLAQNNPILLNALVEGLAKRVMVWNQRKLRVQASSLGYCGGVLGAAAVALDGLTDYNHFSSRKDRGRYGGRQNSGSQS